MPGQQATTQDILLYTWMYGHQYKLHLGNYTVSSATKPSEGKSSTRQQVFKKSGLNRKQKLQKQMCIYIYIYIYIHIYILVKIHCNYLLHQQIKSKPYKMTHQTYLKKIRIHPQPTERRKRTIYAMSVRAAGASSPFYGSRSSVQRGLYCSRSESKPRDDIESHKALEAPRSLSG